jgi:hypothetical protein
VKRLAVDPVDCGLAVFAGIHRGCIGCFDYTTTIVPKRLWCQAIR